MASSTVTAIVLFIVVLLISAVRSDEEVVISIAVHRHGDRSPTLCFPPSVDPACPSYWPEGYGMLSATGMQQLHELGSLFRQRYVTELGLLNSSYSHVDVYSRSTDLDRTLMSAHSFFQGLYPAGTGPIAQNGLPGLTAARLQPVPINTLPNQQDALLRSFSPGTCPGAQPLRDADMETAAWKTYEAAHKSLLDRLPSLTDMDTSLENIWMVADPLVTEYHHHHPFPAGFTHDDLLEIEGMSGWTLGRLYATPELRRMCGGRMIATVHERFLAAADKRPQPDWDPSTMPVAPPGSRAYEGPRLYMYSAHDTTVAALLSALDLYDDISPLYGSNVVLELVNDTTTGELTVRGFYNRGTNASVVFTPEAELTFPGCSNPCPFHQWLSLTAPFSISQSEWANKCTPEPATSWKWDKTATTITCVTVVATLVIVAVILFLVKPNFASTSSEGGETARLYSAPSPSSPGDARGILSDSPQPGGDTRVESPLRRAERVV